MDLRGIENEAEFFPAGTLSEVLATELADITAQWSKTERANHPVERIASVGDRVLSLLSQLRNSSDRLTRQDLHQQIGQLLTKALGYTYKREALPTSHDEGGIVSVISRTFDGEGRCQLWVVDTPVTGNGEEDADPLGIAFSTEQFNDDVSETLNDLAIEEIIAEGIFAQTDAPRYLLIAGTSQWVLVDSRKWPARSVLRINLQEIFSRQDKDTYRVMACLVAREARVPHTGAPLSDRLEEEAQRNANAVTSSLKKTVRDAIEILGQEVLDVAGGKFPTGERRGVWIDGETLSIECLRYMYRMLFLLYAESNPRLGILDIRDPVYASGYSMESLRELESVKLRSRKEKEDTYLWESLQQTLGFLYSGEPHCLKLPAVKVSLLDPESTPLLNSLKLRNEAVQKVVRLLSLRQSKKSTGRISYAKLGIGQLGAVYETLISFTGTVCKEDMIEIKGDAKDRAASAAEDGKEGSEETDELQSMEEGPETLLDEEDNIESRLDKVDVLAPTYFVPRRRIKEFNSDAVVFAGTQAKIYPKGSFTYRLAGRDREKTAAFYTPEPLARLLVKHLLMERCKDLTADELLDLKILEPAMGSAAFLVETTNQLADLYLERKQKEVGRTIPQEDIVLEKQRVRSFIADRNCFGVDLNPTAVELGAISLWLNGLHKGDFSPWFGDQLHAGNSLIGARRAVYRTSQFKGRSVDLWFNHPPQELGWTEARPEDGVFQWLLPAKDMAAFEKEKSIKPFAGVFQQQIKKWRADGFFKPLEVHEISLVKRLSKAAEMLFEMVAGELASTRELANDEIMLWPEQTKTGVKDVHYHKKELLKQRLMGEDHAHNTLPFKRLKTAMDAWCALWLWPLEHADKLPRRQEFFEGMRVLLEGGFSADGSFSLGEIDDFAMPQDDLFGKNEVLEARAKYNTSLFQETNVEALVEEYEWLRIASQVAERARFVHYDLLFADILKKRGGFDLIVGNPPWAKIGWNEAMALADLDPIYSGFSATAARKVLQSLGVSAPQFVPEYLNAFCSSKGAGKFVTDKCNRPYAAGMQNLYKLFMDLSWRLVSDVGAVGLIHQDGHLADPKGAEFRRNWYGRITYYFEFLNRLQAKLFSEVGPEKRYSLNVYRGQVGAEVSFDCASTLFSVDQLVSSYALEDSNDLPILSRKNQKGEWETTGHPEKIIRIDNNALRLMSSVTEGSEDYWEGCRFLKLFSRSELKVIERLSNARTFGDSVTGWHMDQMWSEVGADRDLGLIEKAITTISFGDGAILSGPMIYVGEPLSKTSVSGRSNRDYLTVELPLLAPGFEIRTNFRYRVSVEEYSKKISRLPWSGQLHNTEFRLAIRDMIAPDSERSLIAAVIPPQVDHISTIGSIAFSDSADLVNAAALFMSLPYDYLIKASGVGHVIKSTVKGLPWVEAGHAAQTLVLGLCNVHPAYHKLASQLEDRFVVFRFPSFPNISQSEVREFNESSGYTGFRSSLLRRYALVCLDVLIARAIGMSKSELFAIYLQNFPTLQDNEKNTYYDREGKIAWTNYVGLPGVGALIGDKKPSASQWQQILSDDTPFIECLKRATPDSEEKKVVYTGPFFSCDRLRDYELAWAHFEKLESETS